MPHARDNAEVTGRDRLLVFMLAFAWGGNWIGGAIALHEASPWTLRFFGSTLASLTLIAAALLTGHSLKVPRGQRIHVMVAGFLNVALFQILSGYAQANGATSRVVILNYSMPIWTTIMSCVLLGERLDRLQIVAVALAAIAVTVLTVEAGKLPWVSLALAFSFAAYGFFRKTLPIGPSQGFLLEVLLLSVPALCYIVYLIATGQDHFISSTGADTALLIGCGPVTAVPLLLFAFGARLLRLSTIGIMQYIAPTMVFLIAVLIFDEPFGATQAIAFALIWTALAMYSWSMFRGREVRPPAPATR